MVDGVSSNSAITAFENKTKAAAKKFGADLNNFLLLLTTQLQQQDPSQPMDTNEMTAQIAQYASVEQQINQSELLTQLVKQNSQQDLFSASNLVGKNVEVFGNTFKVREGETEISKSIVYAHGATAKATKIKIFNSVGNLVYSTDGNNEAGKHKFTWDGKDTNGNPVAPGTYTVTVEEQKQGSDSLTPLASNLVAKVQEIISIEGELYVNFGDFTVELDKVLAISEPDENYI